MFRIPGNINSRKSGGKRGKMKIICTVNNGYRGKTAELEAVELPNGKIQLAGHGVWYWSGATVNNTLRGINRITVPLRRYVTGFRVIN
jgi:hypothetical protein